MTALRRHSNTHAWPFPFTAGGNYCSYRLQRCLTLCEFVQIRKLADYETIRRALEHRTAVGVDAIVVQACGVHSLFITIPCFTSRKGCFMSAHNLATRGVVGVLIVDARSEQSEVAAYAADQFIASVISLPAWDGCLIAWFVTAKGYWWP